jgi:hypothetical protein
MHNNGGNYHPVITIKTFKDPITEYIKYSLTISDTREDFPTDRWYDCEECGETIRAGDDHYHEISTVATAEWVVKAIHPGGARFYLYKGKELIDRFNVDEDDVAPLWISPFK